ncbi:MAG: glycosyltransferase family 39 protein [Deltaproteobacteria bacterium]|nr:glycosyltransferase family 39 protein [Deltaproteobacteria bacterium]
MISKRLFWIALLAITLGAAVVRVVGLQTLPPGLFCDEAGLGYNAYLIGHTGRDENNELLPLYVWSFGVSYKNPLFIYTATIPVALFGLSEFSVRVTSAFFGVLAVLGIGLLGRLAFGTAGGLLAALLLAVVPWHVHFSRIAYELIAFPTVFFFAFAALAAGVRGRPRWLLLAGPLFSLCFYAYVPSKLFVPLFLLAALLIYGRKLWAVKGTVALAVILMIITAVPVLVFDLQHRDRSQQYFSRTTTLNPEQSIGDNARRVWDQYQRFYSRSFLFERGDPLPRHAVPQFGELYWTFLPLLALGALWCLWPRHPEGKLFLWWLLIYPLAPAMMNEAPSASRGFIGVGAFVLIAAAGAVLVLDVLGWLLRRWPRAATGLQAAAVAGLVAVLGRDAWAYADAYRNSYPAFAAAEFQYGYREAIEFMEAQRGKYDLLLLTANRVNMPQIFTAFYNTERPGGVQRRGENGYLIIDPAEYDRYHMNQRILAALREDDLRLFDDYTELHRVVRPGGELEYSIAEVRSRKRFIREWQVLGPFDNSGGKGVGQAFIQPSDAEVRTVQSVWGPTSWRRFMPQFVRVDLNAAFRQRGEAAGKPVEWLCAYATTQVEAAAPRHALLEVGAAGMPIQAWVNGRPLTERMVPISQAQKWPVSLQAGTNQVLLKVCKNTGDWWFTARLTDDAGKDLTDITLRPAVAEPTASGTPQVPTQQVDGFGAPLRSSRRSDLYADYRGDAPAWWEALEDAGGEVVWQTDPLPAQAPTVFDFTAMVSEQPGTAELWVNGQFALSFPTGRFRTPQVWTRGPYVLQFLPEEQGNFVSGAWRLIVPAEQTTAGRPVELRVAHRDGKPFAFFQLKGRQDTAEFEQLTLESAAALVPTPAPAQAEGPEPPAAAPGA